MAQVKRGGPHTKQEQKQRRNKVYDLHFGKGYPAIKIADMLHVNRNTVNEDIRYLYGTISEELPEHSPSLFLKQLQRLETQQARLLEELEKCTTFKERMTLERLLLSINSKIVSHHSKITLHRNDVFKKLRIAVENPALNEFHKLLSR